ncbi:MULTISPECIES: SRPBCC family protein [unclassified Rathayibacter]|uniref:SRPBCC family protein n=1 Tax=unclassified Rathayibacter TaxID=2609250 RepID=UPI0006F2AE85|nr:MULTISPECIES: SRPBCC family protein [unclassified Rathayibacter]KQQ05521.1 cyclase [Rathayibacter sp. Leaf294]KQS13383.1 cyclase [Rathayibacter sp. Leaf185]
MTVSIECRTRSARPAAELFDRARDIDLHRASQAGARERAIGGVTSGLIGLGEHVTFRARHFGVPLTLTSAVTALDAPRSFVDEQTRGPFRRFRHEHRFEPDGAGSVMIDRVTFAAPFGVLGLLAERLVLARHLERLLVARGRFLAS